MIGFFIERSVNVLPFLVSLLQKKRNSRTKGLIECALFHQWAFLLLIRRGNITRLWIIVDLQGRGLRIRHRYSRTRNVLVSWGRKICTYDWFMCDGARGARRRFGGALILMDSFGTGSTEEMNWELRPVDTDGIIFWLTGGFDSFRLNNRRLFELLLSKRDRWRVRVPRNDLRSWYVRRSIGRTRLAVVDDVKASSSSSFSSSTLMWLLYRGSLAVVLVLVLGLLLLCTGTIVGGAESGGGGGGDDEKRRRTLEEVFRVLLVFTRFEFELEHPLASRRGLACSSSSSTRRRELNDLRRLYFILEDQRERETVKYKIDRASCQ